MVKGIRLLHTLILVSVVALLGGGAGEASAQDTFSAGGTVRKVTRVPVTSTRIKKLKRPRIANPGEVEDTAVNTAPVVRETAEDYYNIAVARFNEQKYTEAINYLNQAVARNQNYAEAYYLLGDSYGFLSQYQNAVANYDRALQIKTPDADQYYEMGLIYFKGNRMEQAWDVFQKAVNSGLKGDDMLNAYTFTAIAYQERQRWSNAVEAYNNVIRVAPNNATAYYNLGGAYYKQGMYSDAVQAYKNALAINSTTASENYSPNDAYFYMAESYQRMGRIEDAAEAYRLAAEVDKRDTASLLYYAQLCINKLYRDDEAIAALERATSIGVDPSIPYGQSDALLVLGKLYLGKKRYSDAVAALNSALSRQTRNPSEAHLYIGRVYIEMQRYNDAISPLSSAISADPQNGPAYYSLGEVYVRLGNRSGAQEQYNRLNSINATKARDREVNADAARRLYAMINQMP
jgi:tetratricopeptide (TPR) repeat protein